MLQLGAELWASISDCIEPFWEYADWTSLWISGLYRTGLLWVPEWWTWEWEQRHTVHSNRKGQPLLCFQTNNWVWRLAEHWPQPCDAHMLSQTQTCLLAHRNALFNHVLNKGSDSTQLVPWTGVVQMDTWSKTILAQYWIVLLQTMNQYWDAERSSDCTISQNQCRVM